MRAADGVRNLDLAPLRQPGRDQVLGHMPRRIRCRSVHLARILAAERTASVAGDAPVSVDDDLAPGQTSVRRRATDHEVATRVDHDLGCGVDDLAFQHRVDHQLTNAFADFLLRRARCVVRRHHDGLYSLWFSVLILDRDLRLAVRPKEGKRSVLARLRKLLGQPVGERDGERHELGCLAAREADHHALVPGTLQLKWIVLLRSLALFERVVDAGGDVRRLLLQIDLDQRVVCVKSDLLVVVADRANRVADGALYVELSVGRYLADDHTQAFGDGRLACNPCVGVLRKHPVQHRIRDLVADLVGMPFSYRLRCEEKRPRRTEGRSHKAR